MRKWCQRSTRAASERQWRRRAPCLAASADRRGPVSASRTWRINSSGADRLRTPSTWSQSERPKRSTRRAAPSLNSVTDARASRGTAPVSACSAARGSGPAIQKPPGRLRRCVRASRYSASAAACSGEPVGNSSSVPRSRLPTSSRRLSVTATVSPSRRAHRSDESPRTRYWRRPSTTRTATTVLVGLAR